MPFFVDDVKSIPNSAILHSKSIYVDVIIISKHVMIDPGKISGK